MTTAAPIYVRHKPLPEHGTYARANGSPSTGIPRCTCPPCHRAEYLYARRRRHLAATGRNLTVPPTEAAQHLRQLRAAGVAISALAAASHTSRGTIGHLLHGRPSPIYRRTADAILAIPLRQITAATVPAVGSTRRLRALAACGHTHIRIQAETGLTHTTLWKLTAGTKGVVLASTAAAITAAYQRLTGEPGTSVRSRNRAAGKGWHGPDLWDLDIDDPDADPRATDSDTIDDEAVQRFLDGAAIPLGHAEVLHVGKAMTERGDSAEDISRRFGVTPRTITRWRRAHGWEWKPADP